MLAIPAKARAYVYGIFGALSLAVGAAQVGYAAIGVDAPDWLTVALAVVPFVGAGIGYTAATHTPAAPDSLDVAARIEPYVGKRRDEDGDGKPDGIPGTTLPDDVTERGTP